MENDHSLTFFLCSRRNIASKIPDDNGAVASLSQLQDLKINIHFSPRQQSLRYPKQSCWLLYTNCRHQAEILIQTQCCIMVYCWNIYKEYSCIIITDHKKIACYTKKIFKKIYISLICLAVVNPHRNDKDEVILMENYRVAVSVRRLLKLETISMARFGGQWLTLSDEIFITTDLRFS